MNKRKTSGLKSKGKAKELLTPISLIISPGKVLRGQQILSQSAQEIAKFGDRPLVVGGNKTLARVETPLNKIFDQHQLSAEQASYLPDCAESSLKKLHNALTKHQADFIIGVGGGKSLDTAKLLAHQAHLPIVTIPTSAATCAAWTALSNIYSEVGAFQYDVALDKCPDLLILDYGLVASASPRTLIAGIGDAIAKWYEASVSSVNSTETMTIAAVQQARVLRDILFQKSVPALENPQSAEWCQVVDATVLLAGVIGGIGGANCRTVAAHAVHNGLTHISAAHHALHGEKVAYGILVQLRLEEMLYASQLAISARKQLLDFYGQIGLPKNLDDLGLKEVSLAELKTAAEVACHPKSDLHRLPFQVTTEQLMAAMVSTTV